MAFCLQLRDETGVVLIPGIVFGEAGRRHVRLSFAAAPEQIAEGIKRLAPYWRGTAVQLGDLADRGVEVDDDLTLPSDVIADFEGSTE
jgi:hypothetical protein